MRWEDYPLTVTNFHRTNKVEKNPNSLTHIPLVAYNKQHNCIFNDT